MNMYLYTLEVAATGVLVYIWFKILKKYGGSGR